MAQHVSIETTPPGLVVIRRADRIYPDTPPTAFPNTAPLGSLLQQYLTAWSWRRTSLGLIRPETRNLVPLSTAVAVQQQIAYEHDLRQYHGVRSKPQPPGA